MLYLVADLSTENLVRFLLNNLLMVFWTSELKKQYKRDMEMPFKDIISQSLKHLKLFLKPIILPPWSLNFTSNSCLPGMIWGWSWPTYRCIDPLPFEPPWGWWRRGGWWYRAVERELMSTEPPCEPNKCKNINIRTWIFWVYSSLLALDLLIRVCVTCYL